jgi:uncharacterized protein (TIGR03435 family)
MGSLRAVGSSRAFHFGNYIQFAYKLSPNREQERAALARMPKWVSDDVFEIDARAEGNPTRDQIRLMMQSLPADSRPTDWGAY